MKYLNLGCGNWYSKDWINVDFISDNEYVQQFDLTNGIPFSDNSFEVIYHSHVLEHFNKEYALSFLRECYRVLTPTGIIRVVVPDLEGIVKEYIANLELAKIGDESAKKNYNWSMLEMYDQSVRNISGGYMAKYWTQDKVDNEEYIVSRVGHEYTNFRKSFLRRKNIPTSKSPKWKAYFQISNYRNKIIKFLSGNKYTSQYTRIGEFRSSGEIHQWMYDEYSLGELLRKSGFLEVVRQTAFQSNMPQWKKYRYLDVKGNAARKPDSLFMEAIK